MIDVKWLEKELSGLAQGWIVLVETSAENALEVSLAAIKILMDENYNGIIVSANRPYSNLLSLYKKNNINTKKLFIIDCLCKSQDAKPEQADNASCLESASHLTEISFALSECMDKIKGNKFIFIDSITTMLIHNPSNVFARFIHGILTKMRMNEVNGLLISLEEERNREVRTEIAQLCDRVIKV